MLFLTDNFPQKIDGKIEYVIEGGTAVRLLHTERQTPDDVDIVKRNNDNIFNGLAAKWIEHWLLMRKIPTTQSNIDLFFENCMEVEYKGSKIVIPNPTLLAMSKQIEFNGKPSREKDLNDVRLLNVAQKNIDSILLQFQAG